MWDLFEVRISVQTSTEIIIRIGVGNTSVTENRVYCNSDNRNIQNCCFVN